MKYSALRKKKYHRIIFFKTLEAYTSKTKRSWTKLTRIEYVQKSIFYGKDIFSIRDFMKEDHCDASG